MKNKNTKNQIVAICSLFVFILLVIFFTYKKNINNQSYNIKEEKNTENIETKVFNIDEEKNTEVQNNKNESQKIKIFNDIINEAQEAFIEKNYKIAIDLYNKALDYQKSDTVYSGMFNVYSATGDFFSASKSIDKAIALNPIYPDYYKWKMTLMYEKLNSSFLEIKKIYEQGMSNVSPRAKINLIVHFARIAGDYNQKDEAINLWQEAIKINPVSSDIYQAEIDRLKEGL